MGLTEVQTALARLYTDRSLRERFFADPGLIGRELGLSEKEAAQIAQVSSAQVGVFARSLVSKRCGEVEKLMPRTRQAMGPQFTTLFQDYAAAPIPEGIHKHRDDARAFAVFLQRDCPAILMETPGHFDVLRYEAAWLAAASPGRRWLTRHFHYPVGTLIRPSLGVWFRWRRHGPLHHLLLPLIR